MKNTGSLLCKISPQDLALFRFFLEARENLAFFTVLDKNRAIIKISYAPGSYHLLESALLEIAEEINLLWEKY